MDDRADGLGRCPCCGAVSGTTLAQSPALLAVCDVLVVRALEAVGKIIIRTTDRSLRGPTETMPRHEAHTVLRPQAVQLPGDTVPQFRPVVEKALHGAWDVVPAMLDTHGCCGVNSAQVTGMLDGYVRDLLITGTPHDLAKLHYRFEAFLGVDLPPLTPAQHRTHAGR